MLRKVFVLVSLLVIGALGATSSAAQDVEPVQNLMGMPISQGQVVESGIDAVVGTAWTYQGQLKNAGGPVNGVCDMQFGLWDAASAGINWGLITKLNVGVVGGLFTVQLDFSGPLIPWIFQEARWLEIAVRCPAGAGNYTTLSPRQPVTAAPIVLSLPGLYTRSYASSPDIIGGYSANSIPLAVTGATISGGGSQGGPNSVIADYGSVGGGNNNRVSGEAATISGGSDNTASATVAAVGGGQTNSASGGASTIGGGVSNVAADWYCTVGGGKTNSAAGFTATVGGGATNFASGGSSTIGGGAGNTATDWYCTVGGGNTNSATGYTATVCGGLRNSASGYAATVPGGADNAAPGWYSLAAGRRAKANDTGQFVFADAVDADYNPGPANSFNVRSTGGARFTLGVSAGGAGTWQCLASNGSSWSCSSDRNLKENFEPVDGRATLTRLADVPILKWNAQGAGPRSQACGTNGAGLLRGLRVGPGRYDDQHHRPRWRRPGGDPGAVRHFRGTGRDHPGSWRPRTLRCGRGWMAWRHALRRWKVIPRCRRCQFGHRRRESEAHNV